MYQEFGSGTKMKRRNTLFLQEGTTDVTFSGKSSPLKNEPDRKAINKFKSIEHTNTYY